MYKLSSPFTLVHYSITSEAFIAMLYHHWITIHGIKKFVNVELVQHFFEVT